MPKIKHPALLQAVLDRLQDIESADEMPDLIVEAFHAGRVHGVANARMNESQLDRFETWVKIQDAVAREEGLADGAIGGAYVFTTCATRLGYVIKVRNDLTHSEIDLTEYDLW